MRKRPSDTRVRPGFWAGTYALVVGTGLGILSVLPSASAADLTGDDPPAGQVPHEERSSAGDEARLDKKAAEALVAALAPIENSLDGDARRQLAAALRQTGRPGAEAVLQRGLDRFPDHPALRLAWIDAALTQGRAGTALERIRATSTALRESPEVQGRAAQAYFQLGAALGDAQVRSVPGGRAGQFVGQWLLVEPRDGPERFLCCPRESALYQLRQALDAGLDTPAAHVLHARIWQRIGRPQVGLAVLKSRADALLAQPDDAVLGTFSDLALDAGALSDYLRYERRRADIQPERRNAIMHSACLTAAERYSQRGDERLYVQWLYRAVEYRPDDAEALLRLADAEWRSGKTARAFTLYRRVLQAAPHHPQRGRMLQRLSTAPTGDL